MRNHTWELVGRPNSKKYIFSKLVFVKKRDEHGHVVRHRTRITVLGCQQRNGVAISDTYAPVALTKQ